MITTCYQCGKAYDACSEEEAYFPSPWRLCEKCFEAKREAGLVPWLPPRDKGTPRPDSAKEDAP